MKQYTIFVPSLGMYVTSVSLDEGTLTYLVLSNKPSYFTLSKSFSEEALRKVAELLEGKITEYELRPT